MSATPTSTFDFVQQIISSNIVKYRIKLDNVILLCTFCLHGTAKMYFTSLPNMECEKSIKYNYNIIILSYYIFNEDQTMMVTRDKISTNRFHIIYDIHNTWLHSFG